MKKVISIFFAVFVLFSLSYAKDSFSKMATIKPQLIQKGEAKKWCAVCGMNLKMFWKTSHAVLLKDGSTKQYCSLRCLAADYPNIKDKIKEIMAVDAKTQKLINAKDAYYVVGSKIPGTMSKVSKFAFANKKDALEFQKKYGGEIMAFDLAFKHAQSSLKEDTQMVMKKKRAKMYPMGEKIAKKMCDTSKLNLNSYKKIADLKADIVNKKICKRALNEKQLQALALYLFDLKRGGKSLANKDKIVVSHNEKCPVCGMFVYKFPRWAAQIFYKEGSKEKHLSFDGVKDMMRFYLNPSKWGDYKNIKQNITKMKVTDYYTQKAIDAKKAYYVVGSDVLGPMGKELIPFSSKEEAEKFVKDHKGKIVSFNEIDQKLLDSLNE